MTTTKALMGFTFFCAVTAIGISMCYTDMSIDKLRKEPVYVRMFYTTNAPSTNVPSSPR